MRPERGDEEDRYHLSMTTRRILSIVLVAAAGAAVLGVVGVALGVSWFRDRWKGRSAPPSSSVRVVEPSDAYRRYKAEIIESAERNLPTLRDGGARDVARLLRSRDDRSDFADLVDAGVRERVAMAVVEAYFRGDPGFVAAGGSVQASSRGASPSAPPATRSGRSRARLRRRRADPFTGPGTAPQRSRAARRAVPASIPRNTIECSGQIPYQ